MCLHPLHVSTLHGHTGVLERHMKPSGPSPTGTEASQAVSPQHIVSNRCRTLEHGIRPVTHLWEGDHFPDRLGVTQNRHKSVEANCDPAVRRSATPQSVKEVSERRDLCLR